MRAREPGRCPRCGMKLVAGIAEPIEYPLHLELRPEVPWPGAASAFEEFSDSGGAGGGVAAGGG